jgi:hypothetical protein
MKTVIVATILVLGIIVTATLPANASALTIFTRIKFPEVDKNGLTQYTLFDTDEFSDTKDNATILVNSQGYGKPTLTVNHNGSITGKFLQVYTRPDGSKYVMPVSVYLEAQNDYRHALIENNNQVDIKGIGSVSGHTGKITGTASLWVYRPNIPAYELHISMWGIPEW